MMKRHDIGGWGGCLLLFLLAIGSGGPCARAADVKAVPQAPAAAGPGGTGSKAIPAPVPPVVAAVPPAYNYHPAGKADPFMPFIELDLALKKQQEEALKKKAALQGPPLSPLQQAEITQFRLVGIAGDDSKRTAIVEDGAAKKFYPLFVGTYIGLNGGRVASILPDHVIVEEKTGTKAGKVQVRRITVMLHKEDEGRP